MSNDLFTYAAARRDSGIARSVEHADAVEAEWSSRAGALLLAYASARGPWMVEDLRAWATTERGLPSPPDGRAWGAVVRRAARAGTIVRVGYDRARSSNLSPKCLWSAT